MTAKLKFHEVLALDAMLLDLAARKDLPLDPAYRIAILARDAAPVILSAKEKQIELMKKHGSVQSGNFVSAVPDANVSAFEAEIAPLVASEVEVRGPSFTLKMFGEAKLSPAVIAALMPFLKEEEPT